MDDEDLQDEPLQITVLDHDTYSANDAIGKVYIDIDPLLYSEAATVISGWFPIYDTIHGKKCYFKKGNDNLSLLFLSLKIFVLYWVPLKIDEFTCKFSTLEG